MSSTRLLFETFVDTRSPELNANGCHLVSEVFKSWWLPSPGRPEEAHGATQGGVVLLPSITPLPPSPHSPALFTEATGGAHGQSSCVWTGAHGHSQSRGTQRDTGPPPPRGVRMGCVAVGRGMTEQGHGRQPQTLGCALEDSTPKTSW